MSDTKFIEGRLESALISIPKPCILECRNLYEYLRALKPELLEKLYSYPPICLAVYQELSEIARQFVIRTLFVEQAVPQAVVASWGSQHFAKELAEAIASLSALCVWRVTPIPGGLSGWELCPNFKKNLRVALLGGGKPWLMSYTSDKHSKPRDIYSLDKYAASRWNCVLKFMVGPETCNKLGCDNELISPDAVRILLHSNLMKRIEKDGVRITSQGFQFLLFDTQTQVWTFMLQYLDACEERGLSLPECLSLLFQLSFSTLGRNYSSDGMSSRMLTFLQHLREFGLVFQRKRKEGRFYPTRLALNMGNKNRISSVSNEAKKSEGYIIVETNYRVYAYTNDQLKVSILALFTELIYRFPNLVVGVLTRDSVRQALRGGITADQIISYLKQYAHANMKIDLDPNASSALPPTVLDQMRLWELERNRFTFTEGVVYNQFLSQADFITLRDYANSSDALIWQNERTRTMVVTRNGHDDVKRFWKRYSKNVG
ncbi:general transcription factor IIH subunit 4-like [Teleopsis dalmanni]|uniref:general transcription factor IIH subunit 4-like n=1 Tax=Teleopsis dalmanni TaxID=139649 RepID=UPI0018CD153E|nr:general transcription factor IIH subunit 4-like [Teleopsis dalmanni]XP_037940576.1 general transcription factor IIH subunit 4-like [Teleopsis dalmanni]